MAYAARELLSSSDQDRFPRAKPKPDTGVIVGTLAAVGAAPTYPVLTPMAFNTSTAKWVVWTSGGANGTGKVSGFVYPDAVVTDAANEVMAQLLVDGVVHLDDLEVPSGETLANLKIALRTPTTRSVKLHVEGLDAFIPG